MKSTLRTTLQVLFPVLILAAGLGIENRLAALREEPVVTPPEVFQPIVGTIPAQREDVQLVVHAQGVVHPRTQTVLVSEVEGRVVEVAPAFREGGFFQEGDLLLRLDDTDLRSALEEAKSRVAAAELRLAQEQADAEIGVQDWQGLHPQEPAPPLVARLPQMKMAQADVDAAQATMDRAQRDLERTRIFAPYPGRVQSRSVDLGTFVTRGREMAMVYSVDFAEIRLPIPDQDLAALDIPLNGDPPETWPTVRFEAELGGKQQTWQGHIVRTTGVIDPMSRMLVLVAEVEDPYGILHDGDSAPMISGLFVDAWIQGNRLDSAFVLPREAIRPGEQVFVLNDENRLEIRKVQIARAEQNRVIVQAGINSSDHVIYTPLETPIEGMLLRESTRRTDSIDLITESMTTGDSPR